MNSDTNPVALVLEPEFGEQLRAVAGSMPTWARNTPSNRRIAEQLWTERARARTSPSFESPLHEVTLLDDLVNETPRRRLERALHHVIEHHGPLSGQPMPTIHLYGLADDAMPSEVLAGLGLEMNPRGAFVVLTHRFLK